MPVLYLALRKIIRPHPDQILQNTTSYYSTRPELAIRNSETVSLQGLLTLEFDLFFCVLAIVSRLWKRTNSATFDGIGNVSETRNSGSRVGDPVERIVLLTRNLMRSAAARTVDLRPC